MSHQPGRFDPSKASRLDAPDRGDHFPINATLDLLALEPGMNIADIGAGTGYFSLPLARRAAPGVVYAVDPSPLLLGLLRDKLQAPDAPANIRLVEARDVATTLPDASCHLVFLSAVWHELDDRQAALREFARISAPGARLAVLDWSPEGVSPPGPPPEHRFTLAQASRELVAEGWKMTYAAPLTGSTWLVIAQR